MRPPQKEKKNAELEGQIGMQNTKKSTTSHNIENCWRIRTDRRGVKRDIFKKVINGKSINKYLSVLLCSW